MKKLFIASGNRHKIEELRQMLSPFGIELKSTLDFPGAKEVEEDQPTLKGNSLKKAKYWYEKTGLRSIADDTGLEVDALNGEPGVYSARYAGENASYEDNTDKLLKKLEGVDNRKARFRTVVALVGNGQQIFEGICNGSITFEPRGMKGFGYDPVFMPDGYEKTFAELPPEVKNRISHRGKAMTKVINHLRDKTGGD